MDHLEQDRRSMGTAMTSSDRQARASCRPISEERQVQISRSVHRQSHPGTQALVRRHTHASATGHKGRQQKPVQGHRSHSLQGQLQAREPPLAGPHHEQELHPRNFAFASHAYDDFKSTVRRVQDVFEHHTLPALLFYHLQGLQGERHRMPMLRTLGQSERQIHGSGRMHPGRMVAH
jgi:hypothetical protein